MKKLTVLLLTLPLLIHVPAFSQKKLRKTDRIIVSNLQAHTTFLNNQPGGTKTGSNGEKVANDYIARQFSKSGLKPHAGNDWFQAFKIYDGREVKPSTMLKINDDVLVLYKDYFPFAFSANKSEEAAVAIALAENGVPWFKEISELVGDADSGKADTFDIIRKKAKLAADKGASALIIYNKSKAGDLKYNRYDSSAPLEIPVLYITSSAYKKYASNESDILDVKLNVDLEEQSRTGHNIIGYADNNGDSTVIVSAGLDNDTNVAALMEVARLAKPGKGKSRKNYLFVAYCGEKNGLYGEKYFEEHPAVTRQTVSRTMRLDSVAAAVEDPKGLNLVKRSVDILKTN
ncbi:MAG: M28 family peptidase [Chitinophagaceae bacterium]|nr:M28 family peptidase [Chitinophagaceae bacterium]